VFGFKSFTTSQRAITVAGLGPAVLLGCAVHQYGNGTNGTAYSVQVAVPQASAATLRPTPPPPEALVSTITDLTSHFSGKVGVAVTSVDEGWTVNSNGDLKLPQQSVSKLWVAMTALDLRDQGRIRLEDPITITKADFTLFHQPVAALVKGDQGYTSTVGEIMRRALQMSDNTCNDKILRYVGGPAAVRDFIARKQLGAIRLGPGEKLLQSATAGLAWKPEYATGNNFAIARSKLSASARLAAYQSYVADPPDGAAPAAIANALARLKRGDLLSPDSTTWLLATMEAAKTGRARVHAVVPVGWSYGHKTGTGQDLGGRTAGFNDVGILTAPDGKSYALAIMIGDTARPPQARQQLMQAVGAAIVANHN